MVVSITNVSVRHGSHYYASEGLCLEQEQQERSQWSGKLAEMLNLSGQVESEALVHLLEGRSPAGEMLVRKSTLAGKTISRAGVDLTTSAPKSVSLQALVLGDRRLELVHQQATQQMLAFLEERYAFTRQMQQGQRQRIPTGQLAIAQFHHDTSRELDPQLHTHNLILNLQQLPGGQWRSLDNEAIYRAKMLLGLVYRNELAREVQRLGYDFQITNARQGFWELQGMASRQLEQFSKRSQQIQHQAGAEASPQQKAWIAISSSRKKKQSYSRVELENRWQQEAIAIGLSPLIPQPERPQTSYPEVALLIQSAINQLPSHETVFHREKLERLVLLNIGQVSIATLQQAIDQHPHLITYINHRGQQLCTYQPGAFYDPPHGIQGRSGQMCNGADANSLAELPSDHYQLSSTADLHRSPFGSLQQFRWELQPLSQTCPGIPTSGDGLAELAATNPSHQRANGTAPTVAQTFTSGSDSTPTTTGNPTAIHQLPEQGGSEPYSPLPGETHDFPSREPQQPHPLTPEPELE